MAKAGVIEVPHGYWRKPSVARLCELLGEGAGAFPLMCEAYALESLQDGDFNGVSDGVLASRCWFCATERASAVRKAMVECGLFVEGKLEGWDERMAERKALTEARSRAGRWTRKREASAPEKLLRPEPGAEAGNSGGADIAAPINGHITPFIQAENGVSKGRDNPTPAPSSDRLKPSIEFGPLPPVPKYPKDKTMLKDTAKELQNRRQQIRDKATNEGRAGTEQELVDCDALTARIAALNRLAEGITSAPRTVRK